MACAIDPILKLAVEKSEVGSPQAQLPQVLGYSLHRSIDAGSATGNLRRRHKPVRRLGRRGFSRYERRWRHIPSHLRVPRTGPFAVNAPVLQERRAAPVSFLPRERQLPSHRADTCLFPQPLLSSAGCLLLPRPPRSGRRNSSIFAPLLRWPQAELPDLAGKVKVLIDEP